MIEMLPTIEYLRTESKKPRIGYEKKRKERNLNLPFLHPQLRFNVILVRDMQ